MGMTSVRMPDDLLQRLDATATRLTRSKGWIINDAVREYLEREDLRERRDEETREALAELDAGQVIDGDEVLVAGDIGAMMAHAPRFGSEIVDEAHCSRGAWSANRKTGCSGSATRGSIWRTPVTKMSNRDRRLQPKRGRVVPLHGPGGHFGPVITPCVDITFGDRRRRKRADGFRVVHRQPRRAGQRPRAEARFGLKGDPVKGDGPVVVREPQCQPITAHHSPAVAHMGCPGGQMRAQRSGGHTRISTMGTFGAWPA